MPESKRYCLQGCYEAEGRNHPTVASGIATRQQRWLKRRDDLEVFIPAVIEYAEEVLNKTPEMLPVLKEAGVVDSGGQGLLEVIKGGYDAFLGKEIDYSSIKPSTSVTVNKVNAEDTADIKFGYCTEFIILLNKPLPDEELHSFKEFLTSIGDSIVLVADDEIVKVHVHTNHPGQAFEKALTYGALSRIEDLTTCVRNTRRS